ncbi:unnamed protein product, partial [Vitis vinifera]
MNPHKTEEDHLFNPHDLDPQAHIMDPTHLHTQSSPSSSFSLPPISEIVLFRDDDENDDSPMSHSESDPENDGGGGGGAADKQAHLAPAYISPEPHISNQFYTFNSESHALMIRCILEGRLASPDEIRAATPRAVLKSWRAVWKDRNEDTAYLTAWKRIQDKLTARVDAATGNQFLCFKNNSQQFVSHINQWQDIVMSFHGDADLKHLAVKETIERIKQVWTVGAKFYGIPESFIRVCVAACPVCSGSSGSAPRSKRRRFEYTESFDVPAKEVPSRLQQLAAKHKVVLCIRQKYIRYKPFMAEVKDYACHRAGEPAAKKSRILKREPYASKRCGCGFRIRAIVPIANYNEKDKTFEMVYGMAEDGENEGFGLIGKEDGDFQLSVLQQLQELRAEVGLLEGRIGKIPRELLGSVSRELYDIVNKVRSIGEDGSKAIGLLADKPHSDDVRQILTFFLILLFVPGLVDRFVGKMPLYAYSFSITSQCQFIQQKKLQLESTMDVVIQVHTPGHGQNFTKQSAD